jgi:lipopolysaccharide export system permease protein
MMASKVMSPQRSLHLSPTLLWYIGRQYLNLFMMFFFGLATVILLITMVDVIDRVSGKGADLGTMLQLALMKLPHLSQEVMPFTALFAALATFWRLTRSNELVVTRSAGVSVWQFLLPVLLTALLLGMATAGLLNPLASILLGRYETIESSFKGDDSSIFAISKTGLWLRQPGENGQSVIHAVSVTPDSMILNHVIVFNYEKDDRFAGRIDARSAELHEGRWILFDAWKTGPNVQAEFFPQTEISTDLTVEKIQESLADPKTISFWSLPNFISLMEEAGFSAIRHKLEFHRLLATPFLLIAMILLAATFSLRPQRRGRVGLVLLGGVMTGFLFYFVSNFVFTLGLSGKIPVILAAWLPSGVSMMLGGAALLHLEDG